MNLRIGIFCALAGCAIQSASANSGTPSFAAGFEMLNALTPPLPDGSSSWRKLPRINHLDGNALNTMANSMSGNAWIVSEPTDGAAPTIQFGHITATETQIPETFPEGDLESDVAGIIEAVNRLERVSGIEDFTRPWSDAGSRTFGPLMLFAAQLHQAGHPRLADEIAWTLFRSAPNREVVIDAALDRIGNSLQEEITSRFFESGDWQAYHDELTELTTKLPRGWENRPATAILLESLAQRIEHPDPPPPRLENHEIPAAAIDAIAWMTDPPEAGDTEDHIPPEVAEMLAHLPSEYHAQYLESVGIGGSQAASLSNPGLWLLPDPADSTIVSGPAAPLMALGIDAFPVLAALLGDTYPTRFANPGHRSHSFSYRTSAIERAIEAHAQMNRPATRGDLARLLLLAALPDPDNQLTRADPETIRSVALEFHSTHAGADTTTIAAAYLADGSDSQKTHVTRLFATSSDPDHHEILEQHLIETSPPSASLSSVILYAQQRKTGARDFVAKYLPLIREEIGDGSNIEENRHLAWEFRNPDQLEQTLRQLESIAEGISPEDTAREIAAGDPAEAEAAVSALLRGIGSESPDAALAAVLAGADAAEDPQIRFTFLQNVLRIRNAQAVADDEDPADPARFPESQTEIWTRLIADDRPIEPDWSDRFHRSTETIGELAAYAAEFTLMQNSIYQLDSAAHILNRPYADLIRDRVTARLGGEPLPAMPDAANVPEDRLREIVAAAGESPPEEIHSRLDALTPDERAAWFEWYFDPGDLSRPESVRNLTFTITSEKTTPQGGITPVPGLLDLAPGFTIHEDTIDGYLSDLAANASDHSLSIVSIGRDGFPPGLTMQGIRAELPAESDDPDGGIHARHHAMHTPADMFRFHARLFGLDDAPDEAAALISMSIHGMQYHGRFQWWVVDGVPVPFALDDSNQIAGEIETTLAETIADKREAGTPLNFSIHVITREHAETLASR